MGEESEDEGCAVRRKGQEGEDRGSLPAAPHAAHASRLVACACVRRVSVLQCRVRSKNLLPSLITNEEDEKPTTSTQCL